MIECAKCTSVLLLPEEFTFYYYCRVYFSPLFPRDCSVLYNHKSTSMYYQILYFLQGTEDRYQFSNFIKSYCHCYIWIQSELSFLMSTNKPSISSAVLEIATWILRKYYQMSTSCLELWPANCFMWLFFSFL